MKTIDFCCGAGGASVGVRAAGATLVAAFDIDPPALTTHRAHHGACADWRDLARGDARDLPAHDAAVWCPPCEEVSNARGRSPVAATVPLMGRLLDYARLCTPARLLFENVPAITGWAGFAAWRASLVDLGYWVTDGVVEAADFVPQERRRYLLLAARGVRAPRLPPASLKRPVPARRLVDTDTSRGAWRFVADASPSQRTRIARARERFGEAFLLSAYGDRGGATVDHNGRSLDRPFPTVTTSRQWLVVVGPYLRNLTPEECARAQGFPPAYRFHGSLAAQQAQVGRAIPPPLARAAFAALCD